MKTEPYHIWSVRSAVGEAECWEQSGDVKTMLLAGRDGGLVSTCTTHAVLCSAVVTLFGHCQRPAHALGDHVSWQRKRVGVGWSSQPI